MPILCEFDTQTVRPADNPRSDTRATVCFPHQLVARPRLSHGIRALDVDRNTNIRVKSVVPYFTNTWAECHISAWHDTTLYSGVASILVLPPADLDFLTGERVRWANEPSAVRIQFERRFVTPPKVIVFLNHIDLDSAYNWHLYVSASDVDACWIAYPEDRQHIYSMSVNTMDLQSGVVTKPRSQKESRDVTFGTVSFWKNPSVFVALNFLNVDCKANLRLNTYVDGVSRTGLVCHIDSWHDTVVYGAGVSIIAFN